MVEIDAPDAELAVEHSGDTKTEQLNLRVRRGQKALWEDAANEEGITLAAWIKKTCSQAAIDIFSGIDEKYGRKNGSK